MYISFEEEYAHTMGNLDPALYPTGDNDNSDDYDE